MKNAIQALFLLVLIFSRCTSEKLDAASAEKESLELSSFNMPITLNVLKGAKASEGAEPEDMLGMYTIFSTRIFASEHFSLEVTATTIPGSTLDEVLAEKKGELQTESGFSKILAEKNDGFLYETKEINGELNYSFLKVFITENAYFIVTPQPKTDGNTSKDEAFFMFNILNAK
ncbi:MAG: hypothetical protein CMP61_07310 [Flavobacteriales bacterium]|nr:hypothetical protein [Flavobacteriales bacterium]|tara:strand:- start:14988 stop:15509 length:522 start_codon:yes stop_codon:yes gene_type:complete